MIRTIALSDKIRNMFVIAKRGSTSLKPLELPFTKRSSILKQITLPPH